MSACSLPNDPSLDHLKKKAKWLRDAVRTADPDALARVRELHPRADAALARFKLSNAQLTAAGGYGFASWPKLVEHLGVIREFRWAPEASNADAPPDRFVRLAGPTALAEDDAADPAREGRAPPIAPLEADRHRSRGVDHRRGAPRGAPVQVVNLQPRGRRRKRRDPQERSGDERVGVGRKESRPGGIRRLWGGPKPAPNRSPAPSPSSHRSRVVSSWPPPREDRHHSGTGQLPSVRRGPNDQIGLPIAVIVERDQRAAAFLGSVLLVEHPSERRRPRHAPLGGGRPRQAKRPPAAPPVQRVAAPLSAAPPPGVPSTTVIQALGRSPAAGATWPDGTRGTTAAR